MTNLWSKRVLQSLETEEHDGSLAMTISMNVAGGIDRYGLLTLLSLCIMTMVTFELGRVISKDFTNETRTKMARFTVQLLDF